MKILVTGGAGFIGSHLVDAYLGLGHEVAIIDNFVTGLPENVNANAKLYEIDLTDRQATEQALLDFKPELINHQAAHLSVYQSVEDPIFNANNNIIGLLNLMEGARKTEVKKVVAASSGGVIYGETDVLPTPESHQTKPVSPYGISKLVLEYYLNYYQEQYGVDWVALRYGNVYGPRQNPKGETGVIAVFLEQMINGKQPMIFGDGEQTRDYVFIEDVVKANLSASKQGSGPFNIGTAHPTNVVRIFDLLQTQLQTNFTKYYDQPRMGEQRHSVLDILRAKEKLNWEPKVTLETGINRTVEWYKIKLKITSKMTTYSN